MSRRQSNLLVLMFMCVGEQSQQRQRSGVGVGGAPAGGGVAWGTQLPLARVKLIIKTDPDTSLASQEAVLLVTKVTTQRKNLIPFTDMFL